MKIYVRYVSILFRSTMQYKVSFFLTLIGQFISSFNAVIATYFIFTRFSEIKDFNFAEVLLCFSVVSFSFSFAEIFARGFDSFSSTIGNGEFDRIMIRPRNEIMQVLGSKMEFTRIGRLIQAMGTLIYALSISEINWSSDKIITLIFMIIGGTIVFSGLFVVYAALCFFTLEGLEFINVLTDGAREFGRYPLSIYGKKILKFCTFLIPYSLFQYYPLLYILEKEKNPLYIFFPLLTIIFLIPCFYLWKVGLKHYKSTGS